MGVTPIVNRWMGTSVRENQSSQVKLGHGLQYSGFPLKETILLHCI